MRQMIWLCLKTGGKFAPLPIAASRTVKLGGTVATVGFPDIGLQGFAPKLAKGKSRRWRARRMTRAISRSACRCSRAIRAGRWWTRTGMWWASWQPSWMRGGAGGHGVAAGECELRGEEQPALELLGIGAGRGGKTQGAECER